MAARILLAALLFQALRRADAASPDNKSDINLVTYDVLADGSSPALCISGRACLDHFTDEPEDANFLQEISTSPTYQTLIDYISQHQKDLASFINGLRYLFYVVIIVTVVVSILRTYAKECGGSDKQTVTEHYMTAFVFYALSLLALLGLLIYLLISIISTRDGMSLALTDRAPDMYSSALSNLRAYVKETAQQVTDMKQGMPSGNTMKQTRNELTVDFQDTFRKFIAESVMADLNVPLYHMAQDCANDVYNLGTVLGNAGMAKLSVTFKSIGDQFAVIHREHEALFRRVVDLVDDSTAVERLRMARALRDTALSSPIVSECEDGGKTTLNSIDMVEKKMVNFEDTYGVYRFLSNDLMLYLLALLILLLIAVSFLLMSLGIGLTVHSPRVRTHRRSVVSQAVGFMLVVTASIFVIYVLVALLMANFLTAYGTPAECYFCSPYRNGHLDVVDDAFARLWPPANRSELFTRLVPSEVQSKCHNQSVSILDLGPPLPKNSIFSRENLHSENLINPATMAKLLSEKDEEETSSMNHTDLFRTLLKALKNVSKVHPPEGAESTARSIFSKWSHFRDRRSFERLNKSVIQTILVPMLPAYYSRFLQRAVANVEALLMEEPQVVAPCYIVYSIFSSIMDVTCGNFTTELVGHWFALLFTILLSFLVIIMALAFSKYFFRTRKPRRRRLHDELRRRRRRVRESQSISEASMVSPQRSASRSPTTSTSSYRPFPIRAASSVSIVSLRYPLYRQPPRTPPVESYTIIGPLGSFKLVSPRKPLHSCTTVITPVLTHTHPPPPVHSHSQTSISSSTHIHTVQSAPPSPVPPPPPRHVHQELSMRTDLWSRPASPHYIEPPVSFARSLELSPHTRRVSHTDIAITALSPEPRAKVAARPHHAHTVPFACQQQEVTEAVRHASSHTHIHASI